MTRSVAIIGAGIIGLSIGWQLVREKMQVRVFEQRHAGKQASWAAAGMLAPYWEAGFYDEELLRIYLKSLSMYSQFLKELSEDINSNFSCESMGALWVAMNQDDCEWLHRQYVFKKKGGMPLFWLSRDEAHQQEPLLSPRIHAAVWVPSEGQINNRLLIKALNYAFLSREGILTEKMKVIKLISKDGKIVGVQSEDGQQYNADIVINAAGAWAVEKSLFVPDEIMLRPIKGQILSLNMPPHLTLRHVIRTPRIYLAPKQDGSLRVGATNEDSGFDETVTAGATLNLLQNAWEVLPATAEYQLMGMDVGLRPVTCDQQPLIGMSSLKGFYHAIGHGRSGVLLCPYTAYTIKQMIMDES